MPVAVATAATAVHLLLVVTLWFLRVPGASVLAIASLLGLAAAAFLLRDREPLFLPAGVFYVVEALLALAFVSVAGGVMTAMTLNAVLGTVLALAEVLATVLFLVAFSRLVREDRLLRTGFVGVAGAAGFLGAGQVVMGAWLLVGAPPDLVFQMAVLLYAGPGAWLSIVVQAATLVLLGLTWRRAAASPRLLEPSA